MDGTRRRARQGRAIAIALVLLLCGCTSYEPKPIDASKTESDFRSRSLADPGLSAFISRSGASTAWTLETLTLVAFYFHPDLEVARANVALAAAGIVKAGMRPNPTVTVSPGGASNAPSNLQPWIMGLTFDLPIETAGKRDRRLAIAEHLSTSAAFEIGETAWAIRSRLRAALVSHLLAARELDLLRAEATLRGDAVALLEKRRAAGEVSRPEVDAAQIELGSVRLAIRGAEGRVQESRATVAQAIGVPGSALAGVSLEWPDLDHPPDEDALSLPRVQAAGLLNRLDIRRALAQYAASEATLALEVANQYPDLHLGPAYLWNQGQHEFSLGISVTLPLLNQNEGPIAEAEARRKQEADRFLALQARVIGDSEQALARYRGALAEWNDAVDLLTRLDAQERRVGRAVELGDEDRLTLIGLRVQRAVAARARLDALGRVQTALGALEDAVQRPLAPATPLPGVPIHEETEKR